MEQKHGPVVIRAAHRQPGGAAHLPSLTPVWRGAEFQEREVYDLYGIIFDGHPDLRRILMWDGFKDHPDAQGLRGAGRLRIRADGARRSAGKGAPTRERGGETMSNPVVNDAAPSLRPRRTRGPAQDSPDGSAVDGELLEVSMGPQHPSTHGVFRMDVVLDGERVMKLKPVFGYLHRNHEKIARKHDLPGLDALHGPAGLLVLADEQLGLRAGGREARRAATAGARRVHPRHHRGTDPAGQPRLARRVSAAGHGSARHAARCTPFASGRKSWICSSR